jgi:membrane fusion protein (multidrug efflux system)
MTALMSAGAAAQDTPPPSVVVARATTEDITPQYRFVGRVEAIDQVEIRARIEGVLESRNFEEGAEVAEGELLFFLEREPYEVVVKQRQADLAGARATLIGAEADLARQLELLQRQNVSQARVDSARATEGSARAEVLAAEAELQAAELDLSYTGIYSPISGRIGRARYSIGNLVNPASDPLATVTRVDQLYVSFGVTERQLLEARRRGIDRDNPPVAPSLQLSDGSFYEHDGNLDFLSPEVNQSTDTITARALFPNPDRILWPGQFVSVVLKRKQALTAITVPQASMQNDAEGYFVLVVNRSDKVEVRRVVAGSQVGTRWAIENGLADGERVIVQGLQKVRPDMQVSVIEAGEG